MIMDKYNDDKFIQY